MKYIYMALIVGIMGCSGGLPNKVDTKYSGSDFDVIAQIADSMDPKEGLVFWVEGTYRGHDVGEKLNIISNCPHIMKIKANNGVLSYELHESDMKLFTKKESDACISKYSHAIESRFKPKFDSLATYKS